MFYDLKDKKPQSSVENWVAPNATIIGDVTLEKNSSIWFNAVLRGDIENIHIGEGSNIQDGSVLHTDPGYPLKVALNQIEVFFSKITSPITTAFGATQFSPEFFGFLSFKS